MLDMWDESFPIIISTINKYFNSFNHSPEGVMFGFKATDPNPLIDLSLLHE